MEENSNGVPSTDCVFKLAQILLKSIWVARLNNVHATMVQGFNRLVNGTPFLLVVLVPKPVS